MTRLRGAIFVCVASGLGASIAGTGCSSSSNGAAPGVDAATDSNVDVTPDGAAPDGAATTVTLQWAVTALLGGNPYVDGGPTEAGIDGGVTDGGASEGGIDGGAGEGGASDASAGDASAGDAAISDGSAGVAEGGDDAGDAGDGAAATEPPLPGVTVCVYQNSAIPCVTTQADGTFTIPGLPVRTGLTLSLNKTGYSPHLVPIETASTDMDVRSSPISLSLTGPAPDLGVPVDFTAKGIVAAFAVSPTATAFSTTPGTQIAISPGGGSIGPYYVDDMNQISLSATSLGTGGFALFYNIAPGTYTLTYTNSGYDCEPISFPFGQYGIPLTTPAHSLQIVVAAGYVTGIVGTLCTANAPIVTVDGG
jgi:hypothetical protein